jgi:hypothetical protein
VFARSGYGANRIDIWGPCREVTAGLTHESGMPSKPQASAVFKVLISFKSRLVGAAPAACTHGHTDNAARSVVG